MKKIILSAIAIATLQLAHAQQEAKTTAPVAQQQTPTPEAMATRQSMRMQKELTLTDDQKQKVYQAMLTKNQAMQAIKQKNGDNRDAMKAEAKPVREQYKTQLKTILTPEQAQKLQSMEEQRKQGRGQNGAAAPTE